MTAPEIVEGGEAGQRTLLESRLVMLGLRNITGFFTHTNRSVMLSRSRTGVLRLHQGYAAAPDRVLRAIVRFLNPRVPRVLRRAAEREFLEFPVEAHAPARRPSRTERARPGDLAVLHRLATLHQRLNTEHFGGKLETIPIRLSGRMHTRLGELAVDIRSGRPIEIALSRRHLARHSWAEVEHTMLHEMVHQWQAEAGLPVNHGPGFRRKARDVGVLPLAKRTIGGPAASAGVQDPLTKEAPLQGVRTACSLRPSTTRPSTAHPRRSPKRPSEDRLSARRTGP